MPVSCRSRTSRFDTKQYFAAHAFMPQRCRSMSKSRTGDKAYPNRTLLGAPPLATTGQITGACDIVGFHVTPVIQLAIEKGSIPRRCRAAHEHALFACAHFVSVERELLAREAESDGTPATLTAVSLSRLICRAECCAQNHVGFLYTAVSRPTHYQ